MDAQAVLHVLRRNERSLDVMAPIPRGVDAVRVALSKGTAECKS
jgi:hypothetical protein